LKKQEIFFKMKKHLTQKQRSSATQRKLLDSAADVLILYGYSNLTTTRICKEAGVSQGALFKHYATKMELIAALAGDLYSSLALEFKILFEKHPPGCDIIRHSIQDLWAVFSSKKQMASYDLTIASRTDPVLKEILDPIVQVHRERIQKIADTVSLKIDMEKSRFYALADFILMAIQGTVINSIASPEPEAIEKRLNYIEVTAKKLAGQTS
jgi:AcrR family transcriptional regulator